MRACARHIQERDLSSLAIGLEIADNEVDAIRAAFKKPEGQALQMLNAWKEKKGGSRKELADILRTYGFFTASKV